MDGHATLIDRDIRPTGRLSPRLRMLVDLSHAADGHVGIAQDTRLDFEMLASSPSLDVAGLLMATARHDLLRITEEGPTN